MWLLAAFFNPIIHALANVLDSYLVNRLFENKISLIFYGSLLNLLFLPVLFLFTGLPLLPDAYSLLIFIGLAFINVAYLYPYYKALEHTDTSIVVSLFSLGKAFVPGLAFFIVGEVLTIKQYFGAGIIIIASVTLNLVKGAEFKINKSLWWMILCTFILAMESVLYKLVFLSVDWITGFTLPIIFSFLFSMIFLAIPTFRLDIVKTWGTFKANFHVFTAEELATFLGIAAGTFAVSKAPVTIVTSIYATESIFVLVYAAIFSRLFPKVFKERIDQNSIRKKLIMFILMGLGIILVVR